MVIAKQIFLIEKGIYLISNKKKCNTHFIEIRIQIKMIRTKNVYKYIGIYIFPNINFL